MPFVLYVFCMELSVFYVMNIEFIYHLQHHHYKVMGLWLKFLLYIWAFFNHIPYWDHLLLQIILWVPLAAERVLVLGSKLHSKNFPIFCLYFSCHLGSHKLSGDRSVLNEPKTSKFSRSYITALITVSVISLTIWHCLCLPV